MSTIRMNFISIWATATSRSPTADFGNWFALPEYASHAQKKMAKMCRVSVRHLHEPFWTNRRCFRRRRRVPCKNETVMVWYKRKRRGRRERTTADIILRPLLLLAVVASARTCRRDAITLRRTTLYALRLSLRIIVDFSANGGKGGGGG